MIKKIYLAFFKQDLGNSVIVTENVGNEIGIINEFNRVVNCEMAERATFL